MVKDEQGERKFVDERHGQWYLAEFDPVSVAAVASGP